MDGAQKLFDFFGAQNMPEDLAAYFENVLVQKANMFPQCTINRMGLWSLR